MQPQLTVLSLGWGVQSWTLAAMIALGDLPPVDYMIHADTHHERAETYEFIKMWTPWLESHGQTVIEVSDPRADEVVRQSGTSDNQYILFPAFTTDESTGKAGQMRRQCTSRWKIEPMHTWVKAQLKDRGIERSPGVVSQLLGISLDEFQRMRTSPVPWIANSYPLVDLRMSRADCLEWLAAHDLPSPGKSACTFCPFHSRNYWAAMKDENGPDWAAAVAVDEQIRTLRAGHELFVHSSRIPLIELMTTADHGFNTPSLFDDDNDPSCDSGHCFL